MTGADQQIVALFELNALTPEQIAQLMPQFDLAAIKNCLRSNSLVYQNLLQQQALEAGTQPPVVEDISDQEFADLKRAAMSLALDKTGDVACATRSKMIRFLWNEKKGRNNVTKGNGTTINTSIIQVNQGLQQAKQAVARALAEPLSQQKPANQQTLEVESEVS